jgi:hypothetical protein
LSPGLDALLEGTDIPRDAVIEAALQEATSEQFETAAQRRQSARVLAHPATLARTAQAVADAAALLREDCRLDRVQRERLQEGLQLALLRIGGGT